MAQREHKQGWSLKGVLFSALVIAVFFTATPAHAKGFVLITHGDDISKVADIPVQIIEGVKQSTGSPNPAIGYKYGQFGVFFLNIWTWGGEYVVFDDDTDTYWDLGADGAAQMLGVGVGDLKKPLTYTFPPGLVIILVLVLGIGAFAFFTRGKGDEEPAKPQPGAAGSDDNDDDDDDDDDD